jgi:hypothetical protein
MSSGNGIEPLDPLAGRRDLRGDTALLQQFG